MNQKNFQQMVKKLSNLNDFISYLEKTEDSEWLCDTVRDKNNSKNCVMGHLVNWYYGKDYQGNISPLWDIFGEMWATTYMIYEVNDGRNKNYQQPTPKLRVIAYLKKLQNGTEKTTQDYEREFWNQELQTIKNNQITNESRKSITSIKRHSHSYSPLQNTKQSRQCIRSHRPVIKNR